MGIEGYYKVVLLYEYLIVSFDLLDAFREFSWQTRIVLWTGLYAKGYRDFNFTRR